MPYKISRTFPCLLLHRWLHAVGSSSAWMIWNAASTGLPNRRPHTCGHPCPCISYEGTELFDQPAWVSSFNTSKEAVGAYKTAWNDLHYTLSKYTILRATGNKSRFPSNALHAASTFLPPLLRLTESKGLASLANNSSLDVLAAKQGVLVGNGLESASGSRVLSRAEVVVVLDGVAILLGELRGQRFLDVDEDVALDEGLGAC